MKKTKIDLIKLDPEKEQPDSPKGDEEAFPSESKIKKAIGKLTKKSIVIGGIAVLILLGGLIGAGAYLGYLDIPGISPDKPSETLKPGISPDKPSETPKPEKSEMGQILKLSPLVVNLREESGRSYLKATIVLEIEKKERVEEIQSRMPILLDIAISVLSDKKMEDLKRAGSRDQLKQELLEKMNLCVAPRRIKRIYFDEFLYQ